MIKIGDFSKLAHITVKTLHHYGDLGLLKPAHVDRYNGYRYYTLDQLGRVNRILALKDLGFSLEQVGQLLAEDLSIEEMRGMLRGAATASGRYSAETAEQAIQGAFVGALRRLPTVLETMKHKGSL